MRTRLTLFNVFFLLFLGQMVVAQVTGTINDGDSFPVYDAEVLVKGTDKKTFTDEKGKFSIDAKVGDVLVVTGSDMTVGEYAVTKPNLGTLKLGEIVKLEEALVTVAYGQQKKEAIVGSVAVVGEDIIEKQQATSVLGALQGSVAGVNVISNSGQPGVNPVIRIRGIGSINADASPLIVVDGVPFNGDISAISQDMIRTMNVLKDGSALSLYGSRGANGVILIETKKGKFNTKPQVSFMSSFGVAQSAVKSYEKVGAEDYMKYTWESLYNYANSKGTKDPGKWASDNVVDKLGYNPYGIVTNPIDENGEVVSGANLLWDTDWEKALINKSAIRREYGVNVTGGSDHTTYFFGANYLNQEGAVKTSRFERTSVRGNVASEVNNWLELGLSSALSLSNSNFPIQSGSTYQSPIQWMNSLPNVYPIHQRDEKGQLMYDKSGGLIYDYGTGHSGINGKRNEFSMENAVGALYNNSIKQKRTNVNVSGYAKIKLTDYLSLRSNLSYESYIYNLSDYSSSLYGSAASVSGRTDQRRHITDTKNMINSVNFDKKFGEHSVRVDGIMEMYDFTYDYMGLQATGFFPGISAPSGGTLPESVTGYISKERILGYMTRAAYDYASKYYIEGSYRKEATSRFHSRERWGSFFSFGGAWVVSKENFLRDNEILSYLKLKGSYGELGNNMTLQDDLTIFNTNNYFPYIQSYQTGSLNSQLGNMGIGIGSLADPYLTWEKTATINAGVEFSLFKNLIEGSVDYYTRESIDLIYNQPIPYSGAGQSGIMTNVGSIKNYGVEISLKSNNIRNENIEWTTGINFFFEKNKITKLTQDQFITTTGNKMWKVGGSLYDYYLQEYAGVDVQTGVPLWYKDQQRKDSTTGDLMFDDEGNPMMEKVTTATYASATRYQQNKSSLPDFAGGFTNYFRYKNFDVNVIFNFSVGSYMYDSSYQALMNGMTTPGRQLSTDIGDRWQKPGDITNVPKLMYTDGRDYNSTSDRFLFKNNYLRLKALTVGYSFSPKVINQLGVSEFRIYFQGDNLFTWQSHKGIDPEQSVAGTTNSRSYQQRIYSIGFGIKL